jgi:hypothetical protein
MFELVQKDRPLSALCRDFIKVQRSEANALSDITAPHVWTANFHNMLFSRTTKDRDDNLHLSSGGTFIPLTR